MGESEKLNVLSFVMDEVRMRQGETIFTFEVFEAYQAWRRKHGLPRTNLSVDGFGRLIPSTLRRRQMYYSPGSVLRSLVDVELKKPWNS